MKYQVSSVMIKNTKNRSGISIFEVIMAIAITAVVLTSIVTLTSKTIMVSSFSKNKARANGYADEAMEFVRKEKEFLGWVDFKTKITAPDSDIWCLNTLSIDDPAVNGGTCPTDSMGNITNTIFTRTLTLTNVTDDSIDLDVEVGWSDEKGTHETHTTSVISDW